MGAIADSYSPRSFAADPSLGIHWASVHGLTERFPAHSHDSILIGLTRGGEEDFVQNGRPGRSRPGLVRLMDAGVEHEGGAPPGASWSYEALYLAPGPAGDLAGFCSENAAPQFRTAVIGDDPLAAALATLFRALQADEPLAAAEQLSVVLRHAVQNHALAALSPGAAARHRSVERARDLLHAHQACKLTLDHLAREAGMSKFHLIRSFRAQTGLTPWQYQTQLRIAHAKRALQAGEPPAAVAVATGFVDQSHFTRTFRSVVGTTPAVYAQFARGPVVACRNRR
jgi:AraC-like DNA-binding protein